jgi:transposase
LLLHDNAQPHVSQKIKDDITKLGWTTLPRPPYSPDVAPTDYHLFGKLKESIRRTRFEDDDALITATKRWLRCAGPEFFQGGVRQLKGTEIMWRSDILFPKDVSTYYISSKGLE